MSGAVTPYLTDPDVTLYCGDALDVLRGLPDASVHMAATSPPFFGLRDYQTGTWEGGDEACDHKHKTGGVGKSTLGAASGGNDMSDEARERSTTRSFVEYATVCGKCGARRIDSQIGLESSPDEWAERLVNVFREVRRVLRDDGTLWVECGDSYASQGGPQVPQTKQHPGSGLHGPNRNGEFSGVKPKDLIGQPWLLAFALRADGWYLRSCIIWSKPNAMPESVTDRPTTGHSYVFLFSKRARYFYDAEALREPHTAGYEYNARHGVKADDYEGAVDGGIGRARGTFVGHRDYNPAGKNARTVWTIPTEPNALAICRICDAYWQGGAPREHCGEPVVQHFAAFPRELVRRMILAGTSERGVCGECGAPWVREVEEIAPEDRPLGSRNGPVLVPGNVPRKDGSMGQSRHRAGGWHPSCECVPVLLGVPDETIRRKPVSATVLDPFSGSGTTLLVARQLGRHAIGVELNERYCAMTKARLQQLSLFAETPA